MNGNFRFDFSKKQSIEESVWQIRLFPSACFSFAQIKEKMSSIRDFFFVIFLLYLNGGGNALQYRSAIDSDGISWNDWTYVPESLSLSTSYTSSMFSVINVGGFPAISYYDGTNLDLKYVRATNADGSAWGTPVTVDSTGSVGQYASLAIVNGNPAIGYYDATNGYLKYVRATNADGSAWGTPVTVDSTGFVGQYASLAIVNGNPAIGYYDGSNAYLK